MFENSIQITGLIVMAVSLIGVIVCTKLARRNPVMQPVAIILTLAVLAGVGVYAYGTFNGGSSSGMEVGRIYYCSIADRAGKEMKKIAPNKKVVYIVDPMMMESETAKMAVETFKKAYGSDNVEMTTIAVPADYAENGMDIYTYLKPKHIDDVISANSDAGIFIIEIGLPEKAGAVKAFNLPADKRPVFFLTNSGPANGKVIAKLLKDGKIAGIVTGKAGKRDPNFEPDGDNLGEAFNKLYVVVTKDNFKEHAKNF